MSDVMETTVDSTEAAFPKRGRAVKSGRRATDPTVRAKSAKPAKATRAAKPVKEKTETKPPAVLWLSYKPEEMKDWQRRLSRAANELPEGSKARADVEALATRMHGRLVRFGFAKA